MQCLNTEDIFHAETQDSSGGMRSQKLSGPLDDSNMRPNHRVTLQELKALGGLKPFHGLQIVARLKPNSANVSISG